MKKTMMFIITIFLFFTVLFSVKGLITDGLIMRLPMTADESDVVGVYNWTNSGVDFSSGTHGHFELDDTDYIINDDLNKLLANANFTWCGKIAFETLATAQRFWGERSLVADYEGIMFSVVDDTGYKFRAEFGTSAPYGYAYGNAVSINTDYSACYVYDNSNSNISFYMDSVYIDSYVRNLVDNVHASKIAIGSSLGGTDSWLDGNLSEICIWDRSLFPAEIVTYHADGCSIAGGSGSTPSLTLSTNLSTALYTESLVTFNVTGVAINTTANAWNCTLYLNGTVNDTNLDVPINNTNIIFNLTYGDQQAGYDVNVMCEREDYGLTVTDNSSVSDVFIDSVPPGLSISSNFENNTFLFRYINILNLSVTYNDTNLFAVNLSIHKLNSDLTINTTMNNTFNDSIVGTGFVINYTGNRSNELLDLGNWTVGGYSVVADAWDDHTDDKVRPIQWFYDPGTIVIDENIVLKGDIKSDQTAFYISEDETKYKFKITWEEDLLEQELIISAGGDLTFIPGSDYKGHFVYFPGKRWIDFQSPNIEDVVVSDIGNDEYKLNIKLYTSSDEIEFESIGDLNSISTTWFFNISESMVFHARDVFTNTSVANFSLTVWNSTFALIGNETTTAGLIAFNFTGNHTVNFTSPQYADNQTFQLLTLGGNFSFEVFASNSLYIFIYDEETDELIDDRNVTVQIINYDNSSHEVLTDTGSTFQSGFTVGTYEIRYNAQGYNSRSYYATITGSDTQGIDLYLLNSSQATYTSFIIIDETGNLLESAELSAYRYFIDSDSFKVVEMDLSNFNGISTLSLQHYDTRYRFIVNLNGSTVYVSEATQGYKIADSSYTLIATLLGDTTESFFGTTGLFSNLSWNNETGLIYFTVNDPSSLVDQFCIDVIEMNALNSVGFTQVCSRELGNCLNASTGTVTCNVTTYVANGRHIVAKGWIHTDTEYSEYWVEAISVFTDLSAVNTLGVFGVFLGFLVILTGFFAGLVVGGLGLAIIIFDIALILMSLIQLIVVGLPVLIGIIFISVVVLVLVSEK